MAVHGIYDLKLEILLYQSCGVFEHVLIINNMNLQDIFMCHLSKVSAADTPKSLYDTQFNNQI